MPQELVVLAWRTASGKFFIPESVVLYNISTDQIYGSWDITQSGSTVDRIATPIVRPISENPTELTNKTIATKPRILSKPEPQYTEEARQNQITGTVVLSAVFAETGQVTDIQVIKGLSHGLSERAIEAAKLIRFVQLNQMGRKCRSRYFLSTTSTFIDGIRLATQARREHNGAHALASYNRPRT